MPPSALLNAKDLESYLPVFDPRRLEKPAVIRGQNFIFDVDGPKSAFASRFVNFQEFDLRSRLMPKEFKVGNRFFYGLPTGIYEIDPVSRMMELRLPIITLKKYWPWTFAKVGNLYYFAQFEVGLWQYNDLTGIWKKIATPANAVVRGICLAYGRLMCLSKEVAFWSALDNGEDFAVSTVTGAGFQPLSILSSNAFRIDPVEDGVIISTDLGWIKGEQVAANYVFRWYVISRAVRTFSPNMCVVIPDIGLVSLDQSGFHLSAGQKPEIWQPQHGEYLKRTFIDNMDRARLGCCQLYYSQAVKTLYVSFAPNQREGSFTNTHVLPLASNKWSPMDWTHHGFFEITRPEFGLDVPAYMDTFGFMQRLGPVKNKERLPGDLRVLLEYVHRIYQEPPVRIITDELGVKTYVAVTDIHLETESQAPWWQIAQSGVFTLECTEIPSDSEEVPEGEMDPETEQSSGSTVSYALEPKGVRFGGSTMLKIARLVRGINRPYFNLSCWFRNWADYGVMCVVDPEDQYATWIDMNPFSGRWFNQVYDVPDFKQLTSQTNNAAFNSDLHHVLIANETNHAIGAKKTKLYIDGVDVTTSVNDFYDPFDVTLFPGLLSSDFEPPVLDADLPFYIGGDTFGGDFVEGDVFDLWIDNQSSLFTGASVAPATIAKFISGGARVFLGNEGQLVTGKAPLVFCSGDKDGFLINRGIGGVIERIGPALTDAVL